MPLGAAHDDGYWQLVRFGLFAALAVHVLIGVGAAVAAVRTLALVNVGSVAAYVGALWLLQAGYRRTIYFIVTSELTVHAAVATALLGWETGFHLYIPGLLPLVLLSPSQSDRPRITLAICVAFTYLALHGVFAEAEPLHPLRTYQRHSLATLNIVACFCIWGAISYWHSQLVREARAELELSASIDPLTGIWNRRHMAAALEARDRRRARGQAGGTAVLLADLDHFKRINDTHGHHVGDEALRHVSAAIGGALREADIVARWGGEEFLALLTDVDEAEANEVAERIRASVTALELEVAGEPVPLSLTVGLAMMRPDETCLVTIQRADEALYSGKAQGRNRVTSAA